MQQVKHDVKAKLTMQASGNSGGEGARTHVQGKQVALSGRSGSTDGCSARKLTRCLDSLSPTRLPTPAARTGRFDSLLFLARGSPHCRHCCELCCCNSRHIQFGAWHPLEIPASTHNLYNLSKGPSWNKWWRYSIWAGSGSSGVAHNCHYINGVDPILSAKIPNHRPARYPWLDLDGKKSFHICNDIMGSTRKCFRQLTRRLATTKRGRYQNRPNRRRRGRKEGACF